MVTNAPIKPRLECIAEEAVNWNSIEQELAIEIKWELPRSIKELCAEAGKIRKIEENIKVKIANSSFAEGSTRKAFQALKILGDRQELMVLKKLKNGEQSLIRYEQQMEVQNIANYLAKMFYSAVNGKILENQRSGQFFRSIVRFFSWLTCDFFQMKANDTKMTKAVEVEFVSCSIIMLLERHPTMYANFEPWVNGTFSKFSNNCGYFVEDHDVLQAFSHWTHHITKGHLLVVDLQGVQRADGYILTDPAIHTGDVVAIDKDGDYYVRFGNTNLGEEGMKEFFASHKCNSICKMLKLKRTS